MAKINTARVIFLPVPSGIQEHVHAHGGYEHDGEFSMDPAIPIPVEIPEGRDSLTPDELTMEMILSGMLKVIAAYHEGELSEAQAPCAVQSPAWIDYYRRFVTAVRPGIFGEFNEAAILKAKNGDFDTALEILSVLEGLFPGSSVVLLNRALALEEKAAALEAGGKPEEAGEAVLSAEKAYDAILALDPPCPDAIFNAGYFRLKRRDFGGAEACFSSYLSLPETDDEKRENAEKVLREIRECFLSDENFREAWELVHGGKEKEALEKIRVFLEDHPEVWNGWFILGWALRCLERWSDGEAALKKAVELGGTNADVRNELAICLMELSDYRGARRELEAALREDPENVKIISNLGVLAMKKGDAGEAAAFFRTVLELEPGEPLASGYLAKGKF
ncbi:MAG: tetratricopeptide repeat protein [Treponema sp.]|jgi:tetratricopeptide (TPR) repeat protein|nr:tetratricopeptide repeat protein [Treponema sp.]